VFTTHICSIITLRKCLFVTGRHARFCCRFDERLPIMVLLLKHWAINSQINDPMNGTLNRSALCCTCFRAHTHAFSYSLMVFAVHYLQCVVRPAVLPSLQALYPNMFTTHRPAHTLTLNEPLPINSQWGELLLMQSLSGRCNNYSVRNMTSVGTLLVGFFAYFARTFNWRAHAISIRHACIVKR
jgi:DNA polymerase sigma